jgi:hypothetical protein
VGTTADDRGPVERELWRVLEAVHVVAFFTPEAEAVNRELGLRGFWEGYFAARSAPLGTPGPRLVTALFHGFAPRMVEKALPGVWSRTEPVRVLDARARLARLALAAHVADGSALVGAADRLAEVLAGLDVAGHPLAAAHLDVPVPADPLGRVWHAATVLREHRGDGHVAALVAAQVDGVEAHWLHRAALVPRQREFRGWTEQEWAAGADRLRDRGLLDAAGEPTERGRELRAEIERSTDRSAASALRPLDDAALRELLDALSPPARSIADAGAVPYPNAMGVARPARG